MLNKIVFYQCLNNPIHSTFFNSGAMTKHGQAKVLLEGVHPKIRALLMTPNIFLSEML